MDCSTPGFPVLHYLPEFAQIHVHWVVDAIYPSLYQLYLNKLKKDWHGNRLLSRFVKAFLPRSKILESPLDCKEIKTVSPIHWKDWCWNWSYNTLATWWEELTYWKRLWCWERLRAEGEGGDRGWDGWMASLIQWTWAWINREILKDREAWHKSHGDTKSQTWLSYWTTTTKMSIKLY